MISNIFRCVDIFCSSQGFQSGPHSNVSIQHSRHDHKHTQKLWTFLPKVDLICFEKFESFLLFFLYLIFDMACLKVRTSEWYNGGGGDEGQVEKRRNIILMQRFINMSLWVQCKCGPRYDLDIINKMWMERKHRRLWWENLGTAEIGGLFPILWWWWPGGRL